MKKCCQIYICFKLLSKLSSTMFRSYQFLGTLSRSYCQGHRHCQGHTKLYVWKWKPSLWLSISQTNLGKIKYLRTVLDLLIPKQIENLHSYQNAKRINSWWNLGILSRYTDWFRNSPGLTDFNELYHSHTDCQRHCLGHTD